MGGGNKQEQVWLSAAAVALAARAVSRRGSHGGLVRRRASSSTLQVVDDSGSKRSKELAMAQAAALDFSKLESEKLGQLEEVYIDALWWYFREKEPILSDNDFDSLKNALYQFGSDFPTLRAEEVAFVEAAIAYHRGEPIVSDLEYDRLKYAVKQSGRRRDVTAFLLFQRGETLLDREAFAALKEEVAKLGMTAVDLDSCTVAQLEEMYIDAVWAYHQGGVRLLTDEQYDKLQQELSWQGSGFPTLQRHEVEFVKAALSYWNGDPVATDEEWQELKRKVGLQPGRKDVTAFLLYSKGKQELDPATFDRMAIEMSRIGVPVRKEGLTRESLLSITSDRLENDNGAVLQMYAALALFPTLLALVVLWGLGAALQSDLVPGLSLDSIFSTNVLPLLVGGSSIGFLLTLGIVNHLDIGAAEVLTGVCPACENQFSQFSGGTNPSAQESLKCRCCGTPILLDMQQRRILKAGMGARIEADKETMQWYDAWKAIKTAVMDKSDSVDASGKLDLKKTFKIWDKSGDGLLDITEFRDAFKNLGIEISNKELDGLFRQADLNGDGNVDFSEFKQIFSDAGGDGYVSKEYLRKEFSGLMQ